MNQERAINKTESKVMFMRYLVIVVLVTIPCDVFFLVQWWAASSRATVERLYSGEMDENPLFTPVPGSAPGGTVTPAAGLITPTAIPAGVLPTATIYDRVPVPPGSVMSTPEFKP